MNVETRAIDLDKTEAFAPFWGEKSFQYSFGFVRDEFGPHIGTWTLKHVNRKGPPFINGIKNKDKKTTNIT